MLIVHVTTWLDPDLGGLPAVVVSLAAAQAGAGHDVHVLTLGPDSPERTKRIGALLDATPGAERFASVHAPPMGQFSKLAPGSDAERAVRDADVVHLHGVWDAIVAAAARTAHKAGVPYIVTPHGMLDRWSMAQSTLKKKLALLLGYKKILNRAAGIHVLNADEAAGMEPLGVSAPKTVIPNGIFPQAFERLPEPGAFRGDCPGLGDAPFILFLSRLHHKKGLDLLAEAFARIAPERPEWKLVVAGPDGGAEADFRARIGDAGLDGRVVLTGPIYGERKLAALADASCFCLPSRQEGFSIAITEALACGLPAVITSECHYPEVGESGAGVVTSLDAGAVADGLLKVTADQTHARAMGAAGRAMVFERFTWPVIADRMIELYRASGASGT